MTGVLAACGAAESPATASQAGQHESTPAAQSGSMTADQMDAMHEAGVKAFVAGVKTLGTGNQPLQPKIENGVKVFELTCKKVPFEVTAGSQVEAWSYNGQVPGLRFA